MPQRFGASKAQNKLLLDASALMGMFDPQDQYHEEAVNFRNNFILRYDFRLFTTNLVHSEVMSHLTHLPEAVLRQIDELIRIPKAGSPFKIEQLYVDPTTLERAVQVYFRYLEQDFSITDCTCFILMQVNGINAAFTFDDDYKIYTYRQGNKKMGFWKLPEMLDLYVASW